MYKATFYHAGCPVRIRAAEEAWVKSVPILVLGGNAFHINFGASMADVKGGE